MKVLDHFTSRNAITTFIVHIDDTKNLKISDVIEVDGKSYKIIEIQKGIRSRAGIVVKEENGKK